MKESGADSTAAEEEEAAADRSQSDTEDRERVRGLPQMTSSMENRKFVDKHFIERGRGDQEVQKIADVIYESLPAGLDATETSID